LAATAFSERFGRSLEHLRELHENPRWKHASAVGGHAWRAVTRLVTDLGAAIDQGDVAAATTTATELLQAHHNNGPLRRKIMALDSAVGVKTNPLWGEEEAGV
jgi:hypothetical protein